MSRQAGDGARGALVPVAFSFLRDFAYFCLGTGGDAQSASWFCKRPAAELSAVYPEAQDGHRRINCTGPTAASCGFILPTTTVFITSERVAHDLIRPEVPPPPYRRPTGNIAGADGTIPLIYQTRLRTQNSALQTNVTRAAVIAFQSVALPGGTPTDDERRRIGLPEALLIALEESEDFEAARLACEEFLRRNPRPITAPGAFVDYHGIGIIEAGEGRYAIVDRISGAQLLGGGRVFASLGDAKTAVDVFRATGAAGFEEAFEEATTG